MVQFVPHLVDQPVGVGVQICTKDVNIDGRIDILTPSKLGTFLFLNQPAGNVESLALLMREITDESFGRLVSRFFKVNERHCHRCGGVCIRLGIIGESDCK